MRAEPGGDHAVSGRESARAPVMPSDTAGLRILIVSFFFPPHNVIGAVRVGKTAKYLYRLGHDVRVLAARDIGEPQTLALEIPPGQVVYTDWLDVDAPYRLVLRLRDGLRNRVRNIMSVRHGNGSAAGLVEDSGRAGDRVARSGRRSLGWYVGRTYGDLIHFPDRAVGWYMPAVRAGRALIAEWRPDVILASGAPWTGFLVARALAAQAGVPWVADLRDPWTGNPDLIGSTLRRRVVDPWYERRVLDSAAMLVTVTEPIAAELRKRYPDKPVHVVLNGYDPEDFETTAQPMVEAREAARGGNARVGGDPDAKLRLVYTGQMYRDLTPLLDGLALLGSDISSIRVEIIGVTDETVRARYSAEAAARRVNGSLVWLPAIAHREAVRSQRAADVLFLLVHDTAYDAGIYTGKLMEYIGAGRPILVVGSASGVAADLVRERGLGAAERSPERIAARLREWIREKRETGAVSVSSRAATDDFSRETQTRRFAEVLRDAAVVRGAR